MNLVLRFRLFLRKLISLSCNLWDRSTRRLWYIFAVVRSRISPQISKKRDEIHQIVGNRPAESPTMVICASLLPLPSTSTGGGNPVRETHENHGGENLGVDSNPLEENRPMLRSSDSVSPHHESEPTHVVLPPRREYHSSTVIPSPPPS